MEEPVRVPATVRREASDRVRAVGHQLPQLLGRADVTGETAAHADDGDRLLALGLDLVEPLLRLPKLSGHPLQVIQEFLFTRHRKQHRPLRKPWFARASTTAVQDLPNSR